MKLVRIEVEHFACIQKAVVELGPGLNVLYGPNDLGKSTLGLAIRAALLLQHTSSAADAFIEWDSDEHPLVRLTLEIDRRYLQVEKRFGSPGSSLLRESNDGISFSVFKKAREVDEELRTMLGWGIAAPGGAAAPRGLPPSFLSTVLLGEQANVAGILEATLGNDSDESGRTKLTAALEAFAQDPLFKAVLDEAQAQVDLAFTPTGKKKKGRASPFLEVAEDVKRVTDHLEHVTRRVAESDAAARQLEACQADLARRAEEHEAAVAKHAELLALRMQAIAVEDADRQHRAAHSELTRIEEAVATLSASETALLESRAKLAEARGRQESTGAQHADALAAQNVAAEELRLARSDDAEKERRLRQGERDRERLELDAQAKLLHDARDALAGARDAEAHLAKTEQERGDAVVEKERLENERATACARQVDVNRRLDVLEIAARIQTRRRAQRDIDALQQIGRQMEADRADVQKKRLRADALEAEVPPGLPSADELAALRALRHELDVAEARLGGGIAIAVERLGSSVGIEVRVDGNARDVPVDGDFTVEGDRAIGVRIGDFARITITAGEKEARAAARALALRWEVESRAIFESTRVDDLDALGQRMSSADAMRREIIELRQAAAGIEERLPSYEAQVARLIDLEREAAALDRDLEAVRLEAAQRLLEELGSGSLDDQRTKLGAERADASRKVAELEEAIVALDRRLSALDERFTAAKRNVEHRGISRPDEGWAAEAARIEADLEGVRRRHAAVATELETISAERDAAVTRAEAALEGANAAVEIARRAVETVAAEVETLRAEEARLEGVIETQRQHVGQLDLGAARSRVQHTEVALNALPKPGLRVDEEGLARAKEAVESAKRAYDTATGEARKAEGALETVGGQVVREEQETVTDALRLAKERERDVELDCDAWRLLVEKLREAESTEGQHLGEALGVPVSKRFGELTGGRYGPLQVSPQLRTEGVRAAGALRPTASLSVGTQEQLATLLRLTVAEHLKSFLVLDDHLTQTDPGRSSWFVDVLRTHADKAQIVVLTCRPLDYVREADLPGEEIAATRAGGLVRVIDLQRVISSRRAP